MKKKLFIFLSLLFLITFLFNSSLRAQVYSEAPLIISESGNVLTDMIYVKFKVHDLINIPAVKNNVDGNVISQRYSSIKKAINDFCETTT